MTTPPAPTVIWSPQPGPQTELLRCPVFDALFGGSRGGGKSDGMLGDCAQHSQIYGQYAISRFFRRERTQLKELMERAKDIYLPLGAKWREVEKEFIFPNRARALFAYLDNDSDAENYMGQSNTRIYIEEMTNFPDPKPLDKLKATLRSANNVPVGFRGTANPGGPGHCLPYGEVLTPQGWRDIRDFAPGDPVYTVTSNGHLTEAIVNQVHRSRYVGQLVDVSARGLRMVMTPDHKVAKLGGTKRDRDRLFSLVPFSELPGQATIMRAVEWQSVPLGEVAPEAVPTRARKVSQPKSLPGVLYAALLGWVLAEGCVIHRDRAFCIAQSKPAGREKIKQLLDECGFHVSWTANQVIIYATDWAEHFSPFGLCRDKYIPAFMKNASRPELMALFTAMMDGDGHWIKEGQSGTYYTVSEQLADDVAEVALKLGFLVYVSARQREARVGLSYEVSFKTSKTGGSEILTGHHLYDVATSTKRASDITRPRYSGTVYCLGIEGTHTFVVRQHGSVWVSGNSWVKQRYIDPAPNGFKIIYDENGLDRVFIPSKLRDNPALTNSDPGYVNRLRASGSAELVRAWLEGDWDVVEGAFFDCWSSERHVVRPLELPKHWTRFTSFDWGSARPFCVLWFAVSDGTLSQFPTNALVVYREWYGSSAPNVGLKMPSAEIAAGILAREDKGESISYRVADPACWKAEDGPSIAEKMAIAKVRMNPADNSRLTGSDQVRARLLGEDDQPMLYVFNTCINLIRTVPSLQHDKTKPEQVDTTGEDHAYDTLYYGCMSRPYVKHKPAATPSGDYQRHKRLLRRPKASGWAA